MKLSIRLAKVDRKILTPVHCGRDGSRSSPLFGRAAAAGGRRLENRHSLGRPEVWALVRRNALDLRILDSQLFREEGDLLTEAVNLGLQPDSGVEAGGSPRCGCRPRRTGRARSSAAWPSGRGRFMILGAGSRAVSWPAWNISEVNPRRGQRPRYHAERPRNPEKSKAQNSVDHYTAQTHQQ